MSTEETSLAAWRMAVKKRPVEKGLIFTLTVVFSMPITLLSM